MGSTRRRLPPDVRREQIVSAAGRVFAERPYDDVSTGELAGACGVSRGLLNHYFPTKRDLYVAVVAKLLQAPRLPTPAYVEGARPEERIAQSVHEWVGMVLRSRETWLSASALTGESQDEQVQALVSEYTEAMADQICEIAGLHVVREDPVVRVALHGYSAYATVVTRRWLRGAELTREQLERLLCEALVDLVRRTIPDLVEGAGRPGGGQS
ncbi:MULTISPECIES: TetR/AcrR family transcriptional regulator [Mumia]|uniref:TetR/AcrR family transcriptional regulator n=1 Tax=Mumia TaxID=1546255 RepID=UPI0014217840|nr:TetR/AcrR family transcriptional regulator [Mumia sp. ZJ1417]QMW65348.1 TetR/AcrR family transcriptional regulator [Mumia sp. ZJ1417]